MPTAWSVYILECRNGALYTGVTTDVARRFEEHRRKRARYTSYNPPVRVVYRQRLGSRSKALRREAQIKRLTRADKLSLIASRVTFKRTRVKTQRA